jgi:hypothetical protein
MDRVVVVMQRVFVAMKRYAYDEEVQLQSPFANVSDIDVVVRMWVVVVRLMVCKVFLVSVFAESR